VRFTPDLSGAIPDGRLPSQGVERSENRLMLTRTAQSGYDDSCIQLGFAKGLHGVVQSQVTR